MKKSGRYLARALAELGHTDELVVCDAKLPIPSECGLRVVDLAVGGGLPSFTDVLDVVLDALVVEKGTVAAEVTEHNLEISNAMDLRFEELEIVDHEELKARSGRATLIVRTGECSPYANVIVRCGTPL